MTIIKYFLNKRQVTILIFTTIIILYIKEQWHNYTGFYIFYTQLLLKILLDIIT
jgi:hypothetical protein